MNSAPVVYCLIFGCYIDFLSVDIIVRYLSVIGASSLSVSYILLSVSLFFLGFPGYDRRLDDRYNVQLSS